jgi:hypothetical protein
MSPIAAKQITMPAEQSVRLDDEESLLPELGAAGGEDEPIAVEVGELGSFHLAFEDNELLSQHHVFRDKVGTVAGSV